MFILIPSNPPERAIRLRSQFMALYSYLLLWVGTFLGVQLSAFEPGTPHALIFGWLYGINALFYLMIRSGCSERLKDPSLTFLCWKV